MLRQLWVRTLLKTLPQRRRTEPVALGVLASRRGQFPLSSLSVAIRAVGASPAGGQLSRPVSPCPGRAHGRPDATGLPPAPPRTVCQSWVRPQAITPPRGNGVSTHPPFRGVLTHRSPHGVTVCRTVCQHTVTPLPPRGGLYCLPAGGRAFLRRPDRQLRRGSEFNARLRTLGLADLQLAGR
jgi:hypothetical protein